MRPDCAASFRKILEGLEDLGCVGKAVVGFDLDGSGARIENINFCQFGVCRRTVNPRGRPVHCANAEINNGAGGLAGVGIKYAGPNHTARFARASRLFENASDAGFSGSVVAINYREAFGRKSHGTG